MAKVKTKGTRKATTKATTKPAKSARGSDIVHKDMSAPLSADPGSNIGAVLTIDLDALIANYRKLKKLSGKAECAAVVKANAYGLGDSEVVRALVRVGCKTIFVANLKEAIGARRTSRKPTIYVLDGFHGDASALYLKHRLSPVLNSLQEAVAWNKLMLSADAQPAAIHLDTGMNRLGLPETETIELSNNLNLIEHIKPALVMSHLACADDPTHPLNSLQKRLFDRFTINLPKTKLSLANSAGVTLGSDYHYDMTRVGLALYGGEPSLKSWIDVAPVIQLRARILQVHDVEAGETIGYGATHTFTRPSRIATLSAGYADGIFRILGSKLAKSPSFGLCHGQVVPFLGRISMDLITVDVTDMDAKLCQPGEWVELIGASNSINDIAERGRTSPYEVLTSLGPRYHRIYQQGRN